MAMTNAERQRKYRKNHPGLENERRRSSRWVIKEEVLTHYGNGKYACVKCGEDRSACLSIDHIQGGGNKERGGSLRSSTSFYRWLRDNRYPEGYQTLCMNCQFIKRFERGEHS